MAARCITESILCFLIIFLTRCNSFRSTLKNLDFLFRAIGDSEKRVLEVEEPARRYARRSLVAARAIIAGQPISEKDITWKRPGTGISPKDIELIINRKAKKNIEHNELIAWEMLE